LRHRRGHAITCIKSSATEEKLDVLRKADAILREELDNSRRRPDQYFTVLTDTRSVGVKGDERTYSPVIAVRAVTTGDFMACEYAEIPHKALRRISSRITSEIPSVSRVVYDITSKPPATGYCRSRESEEVYALCADAIISRPF